MTTRADHAQAMRAMADKFWRFDFNVVPLDDNKRPVITRVDQTGTPQRFRWRDWESTRQTEQLYRAMRQPAWWGDVHGVAAICGAVSGNLLCVDFDAADGDPLPVDVPAQFCHIAGLGEAYPWIVNTPSGGWHIWVKVQGSLEAGRYDRPRRDGAGHIELRWTGHCTALPGSRHPRGVYRWAGLEPQEGPATLSAAAVMAAYYAMTEPPEERPQRSNGNGNGNGHTNGNRADAWAQAALDAEIDRLRGTAEGGRNAALNRAVFSIAQIVGGGYLSEDAVTARFRDAATDIGLSEAESAATIRSAMRAGIRDPRHPAGTAGPNDDAPDEYDAGFAETTPDAPESWMLADDDAEERHSTWPYAIENGRIVLCIEGRDGVETKPIADFDARITEELTDDMGGTIWVITGTGKRAGRFTCEIPDAEFGSDVKLLSALTAATGALDPVHVNMTKHLRPAIGTLSGTNRVRRRRYRHTGWCDDGTFLLPGRDDHTLIVLPREVAYHAPGAGADLDRAIEGLRALLAALDPSSTTVLLSGILGAPVLSLAGLHNERYALFVAGRTGSLKTSWSQAAMTVYGEGFRHNENVVKLGEGGTRNAIMAYAAYAQDLPVLIDNYKPSTGDGRYGLVNLVHNLLEGSDRKRAGRDGSLRESRRVHCVPIITGEDVPRDDPASLARLLLVEFAWQRGEPNPALTTVQAAAHDMPLIGSTWIDWLSTDGGAVVKQLASEFGGIRDRWARLMIGLNEDSANIARVASNLAVNELTWRAACAHPLWGAVCAEHSAAHSIGLERIAGVLSQATTESLEAYQYRTALREALAAGYWLQDRAETGLVDYADRTRERMLGWRDSSGLYLLPVVTLNVVRRLLGPGALPTSQQTLYGQMKQLGWLVTGNDQATRVISINGEKVRVLHMRADLFAAGDDEDGAPAEADDDLLRLTGL